MFDWCYFLWKNHALLSKRFSCNCAILRKQTRPWLCILPTPFLPPSLLPFFPASFPPFQLSFLLSSSLSPFFPFYFSISWNAHVHKHDGCLVLGINWQRWSTAVCRPHVSPKAARHTFKLRSQRLQLLDCSTNWYDQPGPATIDLHSFCHPANRNLL